MRSYLSASKPRYFRVGRNFKIACRSFAEKTSWYSYLKRRSASPFESPKLSNSPHKNKMKIFLDVGIFLCNYTVLNFKTESAYDWPTNLILVCGNGAKHRLGRYFETVHLTSSSHLRLGVRTLEPHSKDIGSNPIDGVFYWARFYRAIFFAYARALNKSFGELIFLTLGLVSEF